MKAILISIKPKYVAKILNGEKTIEIRKNMPKCDLPIDVYIYCTKDKPYLAHATELLTGKYGCISNDEVSYEEHNLNGKVVAKFTLNKVEEIYLESDRPFFPIDRTLIRTKTMLEKELLEKSSLSFEELFDYIKDYKNNVGYAWHISNLEIFDKPRELGEFHKVGWKEWCAEHPPILSLFQPKKCYEELKQFVITKAPQSYMFIEVKE